MDGSIPLSRKQNSSKHFSKNWLLNSLLALIIIALTSCGSSKPRVVTTKKQAAKSSQNRTVTRTKKTKKTARETTTKEVPVVTNKEVKAYAASTEFIDEVVENAMRYKGVKYRYGGTTRKGMDCSGLICTAFEEAGKKMPRTSRSMYSTSQPLELEAVRKGDFLFFATGKNKRQVNHVALITKVTPAEIEFIHSTTSRGVMTSTLNEMYWLNAFLRAGRID